VALDCSSLPLAGPLHPISKVADTAIPNAINVYLTNNSLSFYFSFAFVRRPYPQATGPELSVNLIELIATPSLKRHKALIKI
jgi:hypothetical protein